MSARRLVLGLTLVALSAGAAPAALPTAEFLHQAAAANSFVRQAEIEVQDHAHGVEVRVYADQALQDYARAIGNVKAAGGSAGFRPIDASLTADEAQMLAELQAADPKAFDKAYIKAEVKVQEQTLALIQAYARGGENPIVRQAAASAAAILQSTLDQARVTDAHTR